MWFWTEISKWFSGHPLTKGLNTVGYGGKTMRNNSLFIGLLFLLILTACHQEGAQPSNTSPPEAYLIINDERIPLTKGGFCWETKHLGSTIVNMTDAASPTQIAEGLEGIVATKEEEAVIMFSDDSEPTVSIYEWHGETRKKRAPLTDYQLHLPAESGRHILEVTAEWPNGEASYIFVVQIP